MAEANPEVIVDEPPPTQDFDGSYLHQETEVDKDKDKSDETEVFHTYNPVKASKRTLESPEEQQSWSVVGTKKGRHNSPDSNNHQDVNISNTSEMETHDQSYEEVEVASSASHNSNNSLIELLGTHTNQLDQDDPRIKFDYLHSEWAQCELKKKLSPHRNIKIPRRPFEAPAFFVGNYKNIANKQRLQSFELEIIAKFEQKNEMLKFTVTKTQTGKPATFLVHPLTDFTRISLLKNCLFDMLPARQNNTKNKHFVALRVPNWVEAKNFNALPGISGAKKLHAQKDLEFHQVTFWAESDPGTLDLKYLGYYNTHPYIPNPIKCMKCQSWSHPTAQCAAPNPTCGLCAGKHYTNSCNSEYRTCANCELEHGTNSYDCEAKNEAFYRVFQQRKDLIAQNQPKITTEFDDVNQTILRTLQYSQDQPDLDSSTVSENQSLPEPTTIPQKATQKTEIKETTQPLISGKPEETNKQKTKTTKNNKTTTTHTIEPKDSTPDLSDSIDSQAQSLAYAAYNITTLNIPKSNSKQEKQEFLGNIMQILNLTMDLLRNCQQRVTLLTIDEEQD